MFESIRRRLMETVPITGNGIPGPTLETPSEWYRSEHPNGPAIASQDPMLYTPTERAVNAVQLRNTALQNRGVSTTTSPEVGTSPTSTTTTAAPEAIQYTYKQGDTFGQVLLDLGLSQPGKLWGPDGDVAYYTQQLRDQGIEENIPIGKTITLTPRTSGNTEVEFPSYLFNN